MPGLLFTGDFARKRARSEGRIRTPFKTIVPVYWTFIEDKPVRTVEEKQSEDLNVSIYYEATA